MKPNNANLYIKNYFENDIRGKVSALIRLKNVALLVIFDGEKELEVIDTKQLSKDVETDDFVRLMVTPEKSKQSFKLLKLEKLDLNHPFIKTFSAKMKLLTAAKTVKTMVQSNVYPALKPLFLQAVRLIKKAVFQRRPIIIRHHFDTDGYCGALAIEKAIISVALEINRNPQDIKRLLKRVPCTLPFYDLDEAVSDINAFLDNSSLEKEPLLILIDNGSTNEDLLGLNKLNIYDFQVIVIDHHVPALDENKDFKVDSLTKVHINPYKTNGDSNLTAGMLCSEIAYMMAPKLKNLDCLATLSGVADKSSAKEFGNYLDLVQSKGYDKAFLKKLAKVIDYLTSCIRKKESRTFIDNLFDFGNKIQYKTVELIYPELAEMEQLRLKTINRFLERLIVNDIFVAKFDFKSFIKRGSYPSAGKSAGLILDELKKEHDKVLVIAYGEDSLVIRTSGIDVDVNDFINFERKSKPYTEIEGGGHKHTASVRFIKIVRDEIIDDLIKWLTKND